MKAPSKLTTISKQTSNEGKEHQGKDKTKDPYESNKRKDMMKVISLHKEKTHNKGPSKAY